MRVTMYRERSGIWMLQWGGRKNRRYVSTGVRDKALARVLRERKERELTIADSSPEIARVVREEVERALSSVVIATPATGASSSTPPTKPAHEAAKEYVAFQSGTLGNSKTHVANVERQLRMFLGYARVSSMTELTRAHVDRYVTGVRADGQGDESIRAKWMILRKFFDWARKRNYMSEVVADEENRPKKPGKSVVRVYTASEALAILRSAENPKKPHRYSTLLAAVFAIAVYAGLRRREIVRMEWSDVDLTGRTIRVSNRKNDLTKTRSNRLAPIFDQLLPYLVALPRTSTRVFPHWNDLRNISRYVREAGADVDVAEAGLQIARHSFVTHALAHGVAVAVVAAWAGHSVAVLEANYNGMQHGLGEPLQMTYHGRPLERHGLPARVRDSKSGT